MMRRLPGGLDVHSDQGSQCTATGFKDLLARNGAVKGMSRYDYSDNNAPPGTNHAESFCSRFKAELLDGDSLPSLAEANLEISHNGPHYNAQHRHPDLFYHSPQPFQNPSPNNIPTLSCLARPFKVGRYTYESYQAQLRAAQRTESSTALNWDYPL